MRGTQVRSLVRELRSHMPQRTIKSPDWVQKSQTGSRHHGSLPSPILSTTTQIILSLPTTRITVSSIISAFKIYIYLILSLFIYLATPGLSCSMWDLVPWAGIEPGPPALGLWSPSYWTTREVPIFCFDKRVIQAIWEWTSSFALYDSPLSSHPPVLSKWREVLTNSSCTRRRKSYVHVISKVCVICGFPSVWGWVFIFSSIHAHHPACFPVPQCPIYCLLYPRRLRGGNTMLSRTEYPEDALDKIEVRVGRCKLLSTGLSSLTHWERSP